MRTILAHDYPDLPRVNTRWLIHKLIPDQGWILLLGPPKSGKSTLALDMALRIAQGREVMGQPVSLPPRRVLYLDIDNPDNEIAERLQNLQDAGYETRGDVFYLHPQDLAGLKPIDVLVPRCQTMLREVVRTVDPHLIIIDVLREVHHGDENDSRDMRYVCDALATICQGRALLILHHTRKIPADVAVPDPNVYGRGSSYLMGRVDANWLMYHDVLSLHPRFDVRRTLRMVWDDDVNLWTFPDVEGQQDIVARVLTLCVEHPTLSHSALAPLAKARWGLSRRTYYRHLAGRPCAHGAGDAAPLHPVGGPAALTSTPRTTASPERVTRRTPEQP